MKTVAILAPTGMLGSMVYNVFKDRYHLVLVLRDEKKLAALDAAYGGVSRHRSVPFDFTEVFEQHRAGFPTETTAPALERLEASIGPVDALINCAGLTKPHSLEDPAKTFFINGALPHILAERFGSRLIHITTDCAFDGIAGSPYTEVSPKRPNDLYGLSKSLGEPSDTALVLRTSIIGPEISGFTLFISWVRSQEGKTVSGFTNHLWNGITTRAYANCCGRIIEERDAFPQHGLFHVFSSTVNKEEMVVEIAKKYGVRVTVEPKQATPAVDRRLGTIHDLCARLSIPPFHQMIEEL